MSFPSATSVPNPAELARMLAVIGVADIDELLDQTVPSTMRIEDGRLNRITRRGTAQAEVSDSPARAGKALPGGRQPCSG